MIKWSSTFSVGVKIIDEQHKALVDLLNDMFNHVTGNEEEERIYFGNIIRTAIQYVKVHFSTEEKIMKHTNFPGFDLHLKAHEEFVLIVVENVKNFESGKKISLIDFTKFLKEWVLTHIAIMDKQYFTHFKKIATKNEIRNFS